MLTHNTFTSSSKSYLKFVILSLFSLNLSCSFCFFFLLISQFQLYFLPLRSGTHAVMLPSFFSSLCRSLYPDPSFSSPPFYLPPSLLPHSVTLGRFLNLKLDLKSQISSFLLPDPTPYRLLAELSSSVSLQFLSSSLHPIYSWTYIFILHFSYIQLFYISPPLLCSLLPQFRFVMRE